MDSFDERILASLRDGKPKDFNMLISQVGFSHNTLQLHLKGLLDRGLIVKQKPVSKGRGRPKFAYQLPQMVAKQLKVALNDMNGELVGIAFSRLRHICRFEKGGRCKLTHNMCSPQICPEIRK